MAKLPIMTKARTGAVIAITIALLYGCGRKEAAAAPTINTSMTEVMEPTAQAIWDIMSQAYNARGDGLDATRITDTDWKTLASESRKLKERAELLALADHLVVASDKEVMLGAQAVGAKGAIGAAWDAVGPQQVQARINANPALFAQKARDLVTAADQINRAAISKNARLFYTAGSGLDEACDGCHEPFWGTDEPPPYPHGHEKARPSSS